MIPIGICLATLGTTYAQLRAAALQLDNLAYDSIWLWDHYVSWNDPREPVLECWAALAGLAEATSTIRLGPMVANNTNHHPARLAKIAATLHELSGGRLELGIGAGGMAAEQVPFGITQGTRAERTARLAEALQIIPALWAGAPVTFHGQHYQLDQAIVAPGLNPAPPIIVGARGAALARLAGRYADGLNLQWRNRADFPTFLGALDAGLAERGRDRSGFDISIFAAWDDLMRDPELPHTWATLGFTRAVLLANPPFPQQQFEAFAHNLIE